MSEHPEPHKGDYAVYQRVFVLKFESKGAQAACVQPGGMTDWPEWVYDERIEMIHDDPTKMQVLIGLVEDDPEIVTFLKDSSAAVDVVCEHVRKGHDLVFGESTHRKVRVVWDTDGAQYIVLDKEQANGKTPCKTDSVQ